LVHVLRDNIVGAEVAGSPFLETGEDLNFVLLESGVLAGEGERSALGNDGMVKRCSLVSGEKSP